eukprot:761082-Hanusia_phi.AAC.5
MTKLGARGLAFMGDLRQKFVVQSRTFSSRGSELRLLADLRSPHLWFPLARKMKRRWVLHIGPTNSGKTFEALQRLAVRGIGAGGGCVGT